MYLPCRLHSYSTFHALIKQPSHIACKIMDTILSTLVRPPFGKALVTSTMSQSCQRAKLHAGIKPTALCSAFDKENSIEFLLDFVHYLYMKSNPNPSFCPVLPYESLSSRTSINKKIKKRKYKRKTIIRK